MPASSPGAEYWMNERNRLALKLADALDELQTARDDYAAHLELDREANADIAKLCHPVHRLVVWLATLENSQERRTVTLDDIIQRAQAALMGWGPDGVG